MSDWTKQSNCNFINIIILCFIFITSCIGYFLILHHTGIAKFDSQELINTLGSEIKDDQSTGQSISPRGKCLKAISVKFATFKRVNVCDYVFNIRNKGPRGSTIFSILFSSRDLKDNKYHLFRFSNCLMVSKAPLYFSIIPKTTSPGHAIAAWYYSNDRYYYGQRYIADIPARGDLAFRLYTRLSLYELFRRISSDKPGLLQIPVLYPLILLATMIFCCILLIMISILHGFKVIE